MGKVRKNFADLTCIERMSWVAKHMKKPSLPYLNWMMLYIERIEEELDAIEKGLNARH